VNFTNLLKIDYRPAIELSIEMLSFLPIGVTERVKDLIDLAIRIASRKALLRRDFAGRLYHEITGNIAIRKGFATFYTEIPAAYLLAHLAVQALLGLGARPLTSLALEEVRKIIEKIRSVKVRDFACGSGTLLTASYSALMHIATLLKYHYNLEDVDLEQLGRELIENGVYGIDALRYASQITAVNLALISPGTITKENVYTIYLGYIPEKKQAWLGSLELLRNGGRVGGLLAYVEDALRGVAEKVSIQGSEGAFSIPPQFDVVIMNPPFTRATGRGERFGEARGLFGLIVDESIRKQFLEAYERVREDVRRSLRAIAQSASSMLPEPLRQIVQGLMPETKQYLSIGQAGEGLLFLYLAYRYVKNGVVVESTLYHYETNNVDEAYYLVAILNSSVLDELIKPMQSKGEFGERDIHKKPLEFPIPRYDPNNDVHRCLSELGRKASEIVQRLLPQILSQREYDRKLTERGALTPQEVATVRREIRERLKAIIQQIDDLVVELLKAGASDRSAEVSALDKYFRTTTQTKT
jgi:hypothetical protein